jgi:hypothetical protein
MVANFWYFLPIFSPLMMEWLVGSYFRPLLIKKCSGFNMQRFSSALWYDKGRLFKKPSIVTEMLISPTTVNISLPIPLSRRNLADFTPASASLLNAVHLLGQNSI